MIFLSNVSLVVSLTALDFQVLEACEFVEGHILGRRDPMIRQGEAIRMHMYLEIGKVKLVIPDTPKKCKSQASIFFRNL